RMRVLREMAMRFSWGRGDQAGLSQGIEARSDSPATDRTPSDPPTILCIALREEVRFSYLPRGRIRASAQRGRGPGPYRRGYDDVGNSPGQAQGRGLGAA